MKKLKKSKTIIAQLTIEFYGLINSKVEIPQLIDVLVNKLHGEYGKNWSLTTKGKKQIIHFTQYKITKVKILKRKGRKK